MESNWLIDQNGIFNCTIDTTISYPDIGNATCFSIEDKSPWFRQRNELIIEIIKRNNLSGNFLDIGGGNGFQSRELMNLELIKEVYLVEPGYEGCLNAKRRGIENVYCGLFQDFDFHENQINISGLFDVIEHIEDDVKFLNELYQKLNSDSNVLINVPALNFLWSDTDTHSGHFRRYNMRDIKRIESETNFKVIESGYYFSYYILPLFLLRVIPFRIGFRKNLEQVIESETENHQNNKGIIQKYLNWRHKYWLKNYAKNGKTSKFGTSMFLVLKKK